MKPTIVFLVLSLLFIEYHISAQGLYVKSFSVCRDDLSARTQKRVDANGNICALIKVASILECEFGGYVIGDVKKKLGEYWVYVCATNPRTRSLIVSSSGYFPLTICFSDYGVESIEGGTTYSLILDSESVSQNNLINGHAFVDLGLSVQWAECNIGAAFPEDYGKSYDWKDIIQNNRNTTVPKYISTTEYDIARKEWKSDWRLPKQSEIQELVDKCLYYSHSIGDVSGCEMIGPSGATIFIPFSFRGKLLNYYYPYSSLLSGECVNVNGDMTPQYFKIYYWFNRVIASLERMSGDTMTCMIRPVRNNPNKSKIPFYKRTLYNGQVTIRGQLSCYQTATFARASHIQSVHIRNVANNVLLYTLTFEDTNHGVFEIQVPDGIRLRFEAEGYSSIEVELDDNIKIEFTKSSLEEPTPTPRFGLG